MSKGISDVLGLVAKGGGLAMAALSFVIQPAEACGDTPYLFKSDPEFGEKVFMGSIAGSIVISGIILGCLMNYCKEDIFGKSHNKVMPGDHSEALLGVVQEQGLEQ